MGGEQTKICVARIRAIARGRYWGHAWLKWRSLHAGHQHQPHIRSAGDDAGANEGLHLTSCDHNERSEGCKTIDGHPYRKRTRRRASDEIITEVRGASALSTLLGWIKGWTGEMGLTGRWLNSRLQSTAFPRL